MMKTIFWGFILLSLVFACEEQEVLQTDANKPVVEGYLTPGQPARIRVTRQIPFSADSTYSLETIDTLHVSILHNGQSYLLESQGNGYYKNDGLLVITEGEIYMLNFMYRGNLVSAETIIPSKPQNLKASENSIVITPFDPDGGFGGGIPEFPDPIELTWDNPDQDYHVVVVANIESDPDPINEDQEEDFRPVFRNEPDQTNTYEVGFQSFEYYGSHRIVLFHILPEYAALYDNTGTSSQNLSTPSSNIENGLGIFTGMHSDTLYVEVTQ